MIITKQGKMKKINGYSSEIIEESKSSVLSLRLDTDRKMYEVHKKSYRGGRDTPVLEFYKTTDNLTKAKIYYNDKE